MPQPVYPLLLDGWDKLSSWGFDDRIGSYYAQLTANGSSGDGPDIWITPPAYLTMQSSATLAELIARATGADRPAVHTAMNDSLDNSGQLHLVQPATQP